MFLSAIIRQLDLLTILMLLYLAYVAPSVIALARGQSSVLTILTVNILLGSTIIGWIASLTWALEDPEPPSPLAADGPDPFIVGRVLRPTWAPFHSGC